MNQALPSGFHCYTQDSLSTKLVLVALAFLTVFATSSVQAQNGELSGKALVVGNGPERYTIEALAKNFEELHPKANIDFFWHQNARPVEEVENRDAENLKKVFLPPLLLGMALPWSPTFPIPSKKLRPNN